MCYAIPGKVTSIEGKKVTVDYFGEKKHAINEIVDLKIGDYIYAQGGYVIQTIPAREAVEVLETWKELFFELRETDVRLSRRPSEETGIGKSFSLILDKAAEGRELKREELLRLLRSEDPAELDLLYKTANFLRQKYLTNSCCVHGIIEFSNYCKNDCVYCGIRRSNSILRRYRMNDEEIIAAAGEAIEKHGFKALVLQAGEDPEFPAERLTGLIKEIKRRFAVLIFISVGEIGKERLQKLYTAGARGLLLRFETSNSRLYSNLHCGDKLEERLQDLRDAYKLGYLIVTGGLIGLPGQTAEDLLDDILLTKELKAEMYTFGPVLPDGPKTDLVLKALAVSRLVDPENAKIVVTTGFETLDPDARRKGLLAGANSVMLNVTPLKFRKLYNIYPQRAHEEESIEKQIKETLELLYSLGRAPTDLGL
ncbi:MAG: radical SAM protein [Candidatus Margulisbacteria bacterium]|nr:radical SAM protein [Candidatus Margulisiibacteriota bacterium]